MSGLPTEPQANVDTYSPKARSQLLSLSHISRAWRRAATSRADLWAEVLDPRDLSPDLFYPYPNQSSFKLGRWQWNGKFTKSQREFRKLVKLLRSPGFKLSELWVDFEKLARKLASHKVPDLPIL